VGRAAGFHRWTDLLFAHWRFPAADVQRLLPDGMELDTWDGEAWVGLVPFQMSGVRPWWSCAVPGVSTFPETNVRTYVIRRGVPGVWFFSLDAASRLAVNIGRALWNLNYFRADMSLERTAQQVHYRSRRSAISAPQATSDILATLFGSPDETGATQGTVEHFLVERYFLYCSGRQGELYRGQVHHRPYPLQNARLEHCRQTLVTSAGLPCDSPPCHVLYSPGVHVEVFSLQRV
jgi:uncharacterized protein YqjF (DUF2071 family)